MRLARDAGDTPIRSSGSSSCAWSIGSTPRYNRVPCKHRGVIHFVDVNAGCMGVFVAVSSRWIKVVNHDHAAIPQDAVCLSRDAKQVSAVTEI